MLSDQSLRNTVGVTRVVLAVIAGVTGVTKWLSKELSGLLCCCYSGLLELHLRALIKEAKTMKYPIALKKIIGVENYKTYVPDLPGCVGNGESIDVSLNNINDSIAAHLSILAEYGEAIPHATTIENHLTAYPNVIWCILDIDITPYLGKSHKINVTLPELLIKQIDNRVSKSSTYKTRSGFIASACISELNK